MEYVKDFKWKYGTKVFDMVKQFETLGFQSIELHKAGEIIYKMKKEGAKIFLTFTSNMGTSGLRGLFAQLVELGMADAIVTTAGAIEEDVMKSIGEKFLITRFNADDIELHDRGVNRIGNLAITNDSYMRFEGFIINLLRKIYKETPTIGGTELLKRIGLELNDENSFLYQAAKHNIPVYCPAITDGAIGFHLFMIKQDHKDFMVDIVDDFKKMITSVSQDDKKALIALGGGTSKHYALLGALINGGFDYAVYITTARSTSGSMSGATTNEAKSWGKIKDDSDSVTVVGDVTILFPLVISYALDRLHEDGIIGD